jgi:hypothetical protein
MPGSPTRLVMPLSVDSERNTEEENNGYVVFKRNLQGTAGKCDGWGEGVAPPAPLPTPKESIPAGWESIPGLLKRFTNTGSGFWTDVKSRREWLFEHED